MPSPVNVPDDHVGRGCAGIAGPPARSGIAQKGGPNGVGRAPTARSGAPDHRAAPEGEHRVRAPRGDPEADRQAGAKSAVPAGGMGDVAAETTADA